MNGFRKNKMPKAEVFIRFRIVFKEQLRLFVLNNLFLPKLGF